MKRAFRSALCTAAFMEFTQISALLIDGMIICKCLGVEEIAAVGIAAPFFYFVGIISTGLAYALQTVCSKALGRGQIGEMNRIANETLLFAGIISVLFTVIMYLTAVPMAALFGARGNAKDILPLTVYYLQGLTFEIVPYVLLSVLSPVVILDNGSRTAVASSITGAVSNVVFDIVSVQLNGGIRGIGLATSASAAMSFLVLMTHFLKKNKLLHLRLVRIQWKDIKEILKLSGPKALHQTSGAFRPIILHALTVSAGGSIAMSVMSIRESLSDYVDIPAVGISGALGLLVGIEYGEQSGEEIEKVSVLAHRSIILVSSIITVILLVSSRLIAGFYLGAENTALPLMIFAIGSIAVETFFRELIFSRISFLQATEKVHDAQLLELASNFISPLVCAFLLSIPFGIYGIYAAFPVSQIIVLAVIILINAKKTKRFRLTMKEYLHLDESLFHKPGDIITYRFETPEHCSLASEQTVMFCRGHKMDTRRAMQAGLCVEEITTNILEHGFVKKGKHNNAEIRITISDGVLIIRVRDNGAEFDISAMARIVSDSKDPSHNIGTKLICKSAKDISYYHIWGMNTTILKV